MSVHALTTAIGHVRRRRGVETLNCAGCGSILSIFAALHTVAIDCHAKHMFLSLTKDLRVDLGIVVADNRSQTHGS